MTGIGYLGAFLGGLLSLLSPCSALLLPGFFAYAFPSRRRLLGRTAVFYLGLVVVLVPLGIGSAAASRLVYGHQQELATAAGVLLVLFGLLQIFGAGFSFAPSSWLAGRARADSVPAIVTLGAVSGIAGFCSGPILGAVLTVAAASGQVTRGAALLAVYGLGMAAPLFVLAALWDRLGRAGRTRLRGRPITLGPMRLHTTTLISGLIFVALGGLFLYYRDAGGLTGLFDPPALARWQSGIQERLVALQHMIPDTAVLSILGVGVAAGTVWRLRRMNARHRADTDSPGGTT